MCTIDGFTIISGFLGIYTEAYTYPVNITVRNNIIEEYTKNGISVNGEYGFGRIFDNTISGQGELPYGYWAQNGIQFYLSTGTIRGNAVSDHWYTGGYWTSTNMLLINTMNVTVIMNTLDMGQTGIYVQGTHNVINGNYIEGQRHGPYPAWVPLDNTEHPYYVQYYDWGSWGYYSLW